MLKISYYDQIFGDQSGSQKYSTWIESLNNQSQNIIEMACGTGDLLSLLSKNHKVSGFDLDPIMIEKAKEKYPTLSDNFYIDNFLNPKTIEPYDSIVCINDSLNYILNQEDLEEFVESSVKFADEMFLDSHHPYRLEEFKEGYLEEGSTDDFDYSYQITRDEDFLIHIINFMDGNYDSVFQWVFDPLILCELFKAKGYQVDVFTDFDKSGISNKGEKVMYHVYKEDVK